MNSFVVPQQEDAMKIWKIIAYAFGIAVIGSVGVLIAGMCVYGFNYSDWTDAQGRLIGVFATIAGALGAAAGLLVASRMERRSV